MKKKRYTPEQIIEKLREAEVQLSKGETVGKTCRNLGVSEQTYYRYCAGSCAKILGVEQYKPRQQCSFYITKKKTSRERRPVNMKAKSITDPAFFMNKANEFLLETIS